LALFLGGLHLWLISLFSGFLQCFFIFVVCVLAGAFLALAQNSE
jgi:hypothetical protein